MDWFTLVFVTPLELLYEGLFEVIQIFVKNLGWALLALSFVTVALMIPLERCVSPLVKREKHIEEILAPQIKEIKGKFSGAEQHATLKRLYSRYRYNPVLSICSALGVLIQLPFLLGAYWMLTDYSAIKGVSFGPIADLSLPDGLLWGVNLLPILMTAINLATIVVSHLEKRDAIQALFVALLFLALLYTAPSALLLYWTMNNVLHFVRAGLKRVPFKGKALKALCENICDFASCHAKLIVVSFLFGVFLFVNKRAFQFSYSEAKTLFWIAILWDGFLVGLLWLFFKTKLMAFLPKSTRSFSLFAVSVILGALFASVFFHFIEKAWNPERRIQLEFLFVFLIPVFGFVFLRLRSRIVPFLKRLELERKALIEAGFVAGILLLFLGVVWFPLQTYASDPSFFSGFIPRVFASSRISLFIACALCFAFVWIIARKVRVAFSLFLLFLGISSLTFAFVVTLDCGAIDTFLLQFESALSTNRNRITDVLVYLATPLLLITLVWFGKVRILRNIFVIGFVVAIFACRQEIVSAEKILSESSPSVASSRVEVEEGTVPEYVKEFHTFSKRGKNVVVVFLDMFTGGNVKEILQSEPELRKALDGFTWYKDVVTTGSHTIYGKAPILGGESATAWILNKDREFTLEEKVNQSWAHFFNKLIDDNFRVRVSDNFWLRPKLLNGYVKGPEKQIFRSSPLWGGTLNYWEKRERLNIQAYDVNYSRFWVAIGLFNLAPLSQRVRIYDNARWMKAVDRGSSAKHACRWLAELDTHKDFSSVTESDKDNRFIFVTSLIAHVPWSLDDSCLPCRNGRGGESMNLANDGLSQEHLRTERCALLSVVRWLKWMKENGVYDNTQVIVVSDHGYGDSSELVAMNGGQFYPISLHGLLLVKNFDEHGELRIDNVHRMANSDVPEIILRNVQGRDWTDAPWMNPERIRYHAKGPWVRSRHPGNYYSNVTKWKIGGRIYDIKDWKKEEVLQ